jgi:hypothetical protein
MYPLDYVFYNESQTVDNFWVRWADKLQIKILIKRCWVASTILPQIMLIVTFVLVTDAQQIALIDVKLLHKLINVLLIMLSLDTSS